MPPSPFAESSIRGARLASVTNIGQYTANRFAVLPEVGFKVGVDLTDRLGIYAGYDFIYLSSVVRPGDQIDLRASPSFLPSYDFATQKAVPGVGGGIRQPVPLYRTSDYWGQGFNFGLQYRY